MCILLGYAGAALSVQCRFPVTMLNVTYYDVPVDGADVHRFEDLASLRSFCNETDKTLHDRSLVHSWRMCFM